MSIIYISSYLIIFLVQTLTVDEHFKLLLKEEKLIDSKFINNTSLATPADLPDWYNEKLFRE